MDHNASISILDMTGIPSVRTGEPSFLEPSVSRYSTRPDGIKAKTQKLARFNCFKLTPCVRTCRGHPHGERHQNDDDEIEDPDDAEALAEQAMRENASAIGLEYEDDLSCLEISRRDMCRALEKRTVLSKIRDMISNHCEQRDVTCESVMIAHLHRKRKRNFPAGQKVFFHPGSVMFPTMKSSSAPREERGDQEDEEDHLESAPNADADANANANANANATGKSQTDCPLKTECYLKVWIELSKTNLKGSRLDLNDMALDLTFDLHRGRFMQFETPFRMKHGFGVDSDASDQSDIEDDDDGDDDANSLDESDTNQNRRSTQADDIHASGDDLIDGVIIKRNELWAGLSLISTHDTSEKNLNAKKFKAIHDQLYEHELKKLNTTKADRDTKPPKSFYYWERDHVNGLWRLYNKEQTKYDTLLATDDMNQCMYQLYRSNPYAAINNGNITQKMDNIAKLRRMVEAINAGSVKREYTFPPHLKARMQEPENILVRERIETRTKIDRAIRLIGKLRLNDEALAQTLGTYERLVKLYAKYNELTPRALQTNNPGIIAELEETIEPMVENIQAIRMELKDFKLSRIDAADRLLTHPFIKGLVDELCKRPGTKAAAGQKVNTVLKQFSAINLPEYEYTNIPLTWQYTTNVALEQAMEKLEIYVEYIKKHTELAKMLVENIATFIANLRPADPETDLAREREHDINIVLVLESWFENDVLPVDKPRRRGAVCYSKKRGQGKTFLCDAFVNYDKHRRILVSTRFATDQFLANPMSKCILLIIDDVAIDLNNRKDVEMLKKLLTGQPCVIIDKFMQFPYPGGIPVMMTMNCFKTFIQMKEGDDFKYDCVYIQITKFIGPPEFEEQARRDHEAAVTYETQIYLDKRFTEAGGEEDEEQPRKRHKPNIEDYLRERSDLSTRSDDDGDIDIED